MKKVLYLHDDEIQNYNYGKGHPMKPLRVAMTHSLVVNYNLHTEMDIISPCKASFNDLTNFHSPEYIRFLSQVTELKASNFMMELTKYNMRDDCPIFQGIFDFCRSVAGASLMAASALNNKDYETVINWSGGLHHAKVSEASGFCYINDIVLSILELLKIYNRVLYIDIDVHHGDGVEEAFYVTDRVMTLSFHKFGDFFPGTGALTDIGFGLGKNYAINVPLKDGIDNGTYERLFVPIFTKIMETYKPDAIFMQCGADCLSGDRLGCFNLTEKGHGKCVEYVKSYNIPTIIVGGGGYTVENVSKAWTYDTGVVLGKKLDEDVPFNEFLHYYEPNFKLTIPELSIRNMNTPEELNNITETVIENLRNLNVSPSVEMNVTPPTFFMNDSDEDDEFLKELDDLKNKAYYKTNNLNNEQPSEEGIISNIITK